MFFGFVSKERGEIFNSSKQDFFLIFILRQSEQLCVNELPDWITFNSQVFLLIIVK